MQSTGQTSTQALSLTLMQGSAITYAIPASWMTGCAGNRRGFAGFRRGQADVVVSMIPHTVKRFGPLERAQLWVERVAHRIPEEIEREDGEADREPREDGHPGRGLREFDRRPPPHEPPRRRRLLPPPPHETQRGFEEDRLAQEGGEEDQVRRHHVREHVAKDDPRVTEARRPRRHHDPHLPA